MCIQHIKKMQSLLDKTKDLDFMVLFAIRMYLVPVMWMAGTQKLFHMSSTIEWFGNTEWGLGLPFPALLAYLAALTETIGAVSLALGLATRWLCIPLIIVMINAAVLVHLDNGWLAIAHENSQAAIRLQNFMTWLHDNHQGRYEYITKLGEPVILNNGVEFAVTYMLMLLTLFFYGAGKWLSVDYWIQRRCGHD